MKKIILSIAYLLLFSAIMAQAPQMFKYQAVLRDVHGNIMANQNKTVVIDILQSNLTNSVFTETHNVTTTAEGLINLNIGSIENLSGIDWKADEYYIQVKVNGVIFSTTRLFSVPYAITSKTVENVDYSQIPNPPSIPADVSDFSDTTHLLFDGNYNSLTNLPVLFSGSYPDLTNKPVNATTTTDGFMGATDKIKSDNLENLNLTAGTGILVTGTFPNLNIDNTGFNGPHYLGEEYLGGIIFYLYKGSDGLQHGLVVSKTDTSSLWQFMFSITNADRTEDGLYNTGLMVYSSAKIWVESLGPYWYLPSIDELGLLWSNRFYVNKTARSIGSALLVADANFWSSTEYSKNSAYYFSFSNGSCGCYGKEAYFKVRGIRAF